jgi:putative DNA primase/helicase
MNPTAIHDHIAAFQAAIQDAGLGRPDISADDALTRFSCLKCKAESKRRNRNAWYRYFNGRTPGGAFGCWRCGATHTWCSKKSLVGEECEEFKQRMESVKSERDKALAETHRKARDRAVWVWKHATEANGHPYLEAKGVQSHGLRVYKGALVVPIRNEAGELISFQFIPPDGTSKRFLKDGETAGGFYVLGNLNDHIFVGEGYATMASCFEATGRGCVVAFNAGPKAWDFSGASISARRTLTCLRSTSTVSVSPSASVQS